MVAETVRTPFEMEAIKGPFAAVMDTNVSLDVYGIFDFAKALRPLVEPRIYRSSLLHEALAYRMNRTRNAWWFVMAMDHLGLNTLGFTDEFKRKLAKLIPPTSEFAPWTAVMADFVKPAVAPRWQNISSDRDRNVKGNAVDRLLITMAKEHGLPIVTCEEDKLVMKTAKEQGVDVFLPGEFAANTGLSFEEARRVFFDRFDQKAVIYTVDFSIKTGRSADRYICAKSVHRARDEFEVIWEAPPTAPGRRRLSLPTAA